MVEVFIKHASQEIDRLIFFPLRYQNIEATVDLLGCAIQVTRLKKPSADLQQIMISILVQLYET